MTHWTPAEHKSPPDNFVRIKRESKDIERIPLTQMWSTSKAVNKYKFQKQESVPLPHQNRISESTDVNSDQQGSLFEQISKQLNTSLYIDLRSEKESLFDNSYYNGKTDTGIMYNKYNN